MNKIWKIYNFFEDVIGGKNTGCGVRHIVEGYHRTPHEWFVTDTIGDSINYLD